MQRDATSPTPAAAPPTLPRAARPDAAPPVWQVRLLGGIEARSATRRIDRWPTRAVAALLARLALEPQRAHPREELIECLWPGVAPDAGRNRLRQALSTLKRLLESGGEAPVLQADRLAVRVLPGRIACDALQPRAEAGGGIAGDALAGELMPGFHDDWVIARRARLAAAPPAAPDAADPAPAAGDPIGAGLPHYLTRAFGVDAAAAALRSAVLAERLVTLRGPGGSGKTRLAAEVARSLLQPAAWRGGASPAAPFDRVVFVALAACRDAAALVDALLLALQHGGSAIGSAAARCDAVCAALAGRRTLLVLDNFEQLVDAAAAEVGDWLARLPELHLLVTSRRPLGLDGEHEQPLAGLALPAADAGWPELLASPAVALLLDRARAAGVEIRAGSDDAAAVAGLVLRLDGLPLALELAAARLRGAGVGELLQALGGWPPQPADPLLPDAARWQSLARRGARPGDDARQASMLAVVRWSLDLLGATQRQTLLALAMFHAGAGAAQLAEMFDAPPGAALVDDLDALVAASVVRALPQPHGATRYLPFEAVREVVLALAGADRLRALAARHRAAMRHWAAALGPSPDLHAVRAAVADIVAALTSALADGAPGEGLALLIDLAPALHEVVLPPLGRERFAAAVEAAAGTPLALAARPLLAEQLFESGHGDEALARAEAALRDSAADGTPAPTRALALRVAARLRVRVRADFAGARPLAEAAAALAREQGLADIEATATALLAAIEMNSTRDLARNEALHRHALARWRDAGLEQRAVVGMVNLSLALGAQHRSDEQLALLAQAIPLAQANGQRRLLIFARSIQGYALADQRRWRESAAAYRECLAEAWSINAWREWFYGLWNLPRTLVPLGRADDAVRLLGCAERFYAERFGALPRSDLREKRRTLRWADLHLGAARRPALWLAGRSLTPLQAMRIACSD